MIIPYLRLLREYEQALLVGPVNRKVVNGPGMVYVGPLTSCTVRTALTLTPTQYAKIEDAIAGTVRVVRGPGLYFFTANESSYKVHDALALKTYEYVRIQDRSSGKIRIEKGEKQVLLEPLETILGGQQSGINVDEHTAVLVRNDRDGTLRLVTQPQVFIPSADESVVEPREKIVLQSHETAIIKDKNGTFVFRSGTDKEPSFFLGPFEELVTMEWSRGKRKDARDLLVQKFDTRPKYMGFECDVRTKDNVELVLELTFFWQIKEMPRLVAHTDDPTGDICSHARSRIIQAVSRSSLQDFLEGSNSIIQKVLVDEGDDFYSQRGTQIHAVEVTSIKCKDPKTQAVLNDIIQEATNRLNNLQKQEGENEVRLNKLKGEIEEEKLRSELLTIQSQHSIQQAGAEGQAQASRVKVFFEKLGDMTLEKKLEIFGALNKAQILADLSKGSAQLYFTPQEVDLTIESRKK